tara:strand:+ start:26 stop:136 length:111 start_codon:yes stop_codon:yes gene_type:complete
MSKINYEQNSLQLKTGAALKTSHSTFTLKIKLKGKK